MDGDIAKWTWLISRTNGHLGPDVQRQHRNDCRAAA
jgi:hypothetical protein